MPFKRLQYKTTYDRRLVGNIPEFMPLDNSHNRDILHSLLSHCVFHRFVLKGEVNNEDKKRYLVMPPKRNFHWKIIEDVDQVLECWKFSTMRISWKFKDRQIGIYTEEWWWVMVKLGDGEACKVKVRDVSAILTGTCSCTVIC